MSVSDQVIKRELEVQLTDEEREQRREAVTQLVGEYDALEVKKKAATSEFSSRMKQLRQSISTASAAARNGVETREVNCYDKWEFSQNAVKTIRMDTEAVVETRAMTPEERQTSIAGTEKASPVVPVKGGKKKLGKGADKPDEPLGDGEASSSEAH